MSILVSLRSDYALIPACEPFRETGALVDTILIPDAALSHGEFLPGREVRLRYPAAYRESGPQRDPSRILRDHWLEFEMYVANALPVPSEEPTNPATGKIVPLQDRKPSISFYSNTREPVARSASRALWIDFGALGSFDELGRTPALTLASSPYPGLMTVTYPAPKDAGFDPRTNFVRMEGGTIEELVQCRGPDRVPNPQCTFMLDQSGLAIKGRFPLKQMGEWPGIRDKVRSFAECSVKAAM